MKSSMILTDETVPDRKTLNGFFNHIASRYDGLNGLLSLRLDRYWRKRARALVSEGHERSILDLGAGTGKFLETFLRGKKFSLAVGLDFADQMIEVGRKKLPGSVQWIQGDFHDLPFEAESFDLVISAFTLRSVKERPRFFSEIYRVLGDRGKAAFLCLTRPTNFLSRMLYRPYLRIYVPLVGGMISGSKDAYRFLSDSIQGFQEPTKTVDQLLRCGFDSVRVYPLTLGLATLMIAKK